MKTQISKQHATTLGVQRPTILNPKINLGLLWQAFFMLLLIAAMVVPGAAQGIYVANNVNTLATSTTYFGEYKLDGTPVNTDLAGIGHSYVQGFTVFGSSLVVPFMDLYRWNSYGYNGTVYEFNASTGQLFLWDSFPTLTNPRAAVVSEGHLFVLYSLYGYGSTIGEYNPTTGATINATLAHVNNGQQIAASPGPGGTVNLFVTSEQGSIQEITVTGGTATAPTTLVSGLYYPEGIAVSEDGRYVYVVNVWTASDHNHGQIYQYDTLTGRLTLLVANIPGPFDIAVSGSNLLVTQNFTIGEYDATTGATVNANLVTGLQSPSGIAVTPGDGTAFCTPPPSNMVAWYSFDQYLPPWLGVQYDLAKGNDAMTYGPQRMAGKVSNALYFDGISSYAEAPDSSPLHIGTQDLSVDAWVKIANPNDETGSRIIVDKRQSNPVQGYSFFLYNGRLALQLAYNGGYTNYLSWTTVPADNQWHLVAVTVSRTSPTGGTWYLDGSPTWDSPFNPTGHQGSLNSSAPLEIGMIESSLGGGNGRFFKGGMDEVQIFSKALSANEVSAIYSAGSAGQCK